MELRPQPRRSRLADLCHVLGISAEPGDVTGMALDTRLVQPGDLFAALPGAHVHGAQFAAAAVHRGAVAILTDAAGAAQVDGTSVPVLVVNDPRAALGSLARVIYPGARPRLVGITGTNGKTTTAHCVAACAEAAGQPTAVIGTLGIAFRALHDYSGRTTPEAPSLHAALARLAEEGAAVAAMEVSSHALALHRVAGLEFEVAVFLGLTQDHLDFHGSMDEYFAAKASLFTSARSRFGVINVDDAWGRRLAATCEIPHVTYGVQQMADWRATDRAITSEGRSQFSAVGPAGSFRVTVGMPGEFNIANALASLASAHALGLDVSTALSGLAEVSVPGRLERIANSLGIAAYVDYAHTPDAVVRVLDVVRAGLAGRLITVLGCGGDRDAVKRPLMGEAAALHSDVVIVTDDNPRSEDPASIRAAVLSGTTRAADVREIADRATAIRAAVADARAGDCIMVLGKGHETGQEIAGVVHAFDDRVELRRALDARATDVRA